MVGEGAVLEDFYFPRGNKYIITGRKMVRTIRENIKCNQAKGEFSRIEELSKSFMEEVVFNLDPEQSLKSIEFHLY